MLHQLFSLYQKLPKKLREPKETVDKPIKANGTRWIDHKVRAMKVFLENYGMYMQHLEQVSNFNILLHSPHSQTGCSFPFNIAISHAIYWRVPQETCEHFKTFLGRLLSF